MGGLMNHDECTDALSRVAKVFARSAMEAGTDTPIPTCPGWSARDLVIHLGDVHRWATKAIVDAVDDDTEEHTPASGVEIGEWYRSGANGLIDALRTTPADREVWTFGPPPHRVAFWSRRQLHETTVHLWDLEAALGEPSPIDATGARDGIDEVCSMFYPRQVRLDRMQPLPAAIGLSDGAFESVLGTGPPVASVFGPAPDLLLLLWKRRAIEHPAFEVEGDRTAVRFVLSERITP